MMIHSQKGFSLIELMTVVGIIGVLSAVALPQYAQYQAKTKVAAGLAEITALKSGFESVKNDGSFVDADGANIGLASPTTQHCNITIIDVSTDQTVSSMTCTLVNPPAAVSGGTITLTRTNATGTWACTVSGIGANYKPKGC